MTPPTGTITFLFTDIEGSTKLWEAYPQTMQQALERHDILLRHAIESEKGQVFKTVGDAFYAAFAAAPDALNAALSAQLALGSEPWPEATPLRVRMALHNLAIVARNLGDPEAAARYQSESEESAQASGEPIGILYALLGQMNAAMEARDYVRAKRHLAEVAALAREMQMTKVWPVGLKNCAYIALHLSGPVKSARLFGATERLREATGETMSPAELPWYEAALTEVRAAMGDAAAFERAWQEGRALTRDQAVNYALAPDEREG